MIRLNVFLGYGCNQKCVYCNNRKDIELDFTDFDSIKKFTDFFREKSDILIELEGGDAFYYTEMTKKILSLKLPTYLFTNGTLITEEMIPFIHEKAEVRISLDGVEELHLKQRPLTEGGNSFQATLKGIKILQKHNIPFFLASVVTDISFPYLNESKDLILSLNPKRWILTTQMYKPKNNEKTKQIYDKAAPIINSWTDPRISFHSFHNPKIDKNPEIVTLFKKDKIQINIEGFDTPILKEYLPDRLSEVIKEVADYKKL